MRRITEVDVEDAVSNGTEETLLAEARKDGMGKLQKVVIMINQEKERREEKPSLYEQITRDTTIRTSEGTNTGDRLHA